jgi:hypothetical protein
MNHVVADASPDDLEHEPEWQCLPEVFVDNEMNFVSFEKKEGENHDSDKHACEPQWLFLEPLLDSDESESDHSLMYQFIRTVEKPLDDTGGNDEANECRDPYATHRAIYTAFLSLHACPPCIDSVKYSTIFLRNINNHARAR